MGKVVSRRLAWVLVLAWGLFGFLRPAIAASASSSVQAVHPAATGSARPMALNAAGPAVVTLRIAGPINPAVAAYVERGLREAAAPDAGDVQAVVLLMDTPGGLDSAMRRIIQAMLASPVPVVAYVWPSGGRSASAGMYIVEASGVAAMAPGTTIGAAHPVQAGGQDLGGSMKHKVENDAAAYAIGLAREHGRNAAWVERAVRESVDVHAREAERLKVVDLVAPDLGTLLARIDGRRVRGSAGVRVLHTRSATVRELAMTPLEGFLNGLADPSLALILINVGMLGLFFELSRPGAILPGLVGVICLVMGFFALGALAVNYAGLGLMAFGFLLFAMELFTPAHGALTTGGVIALALGGLMLVSGNGPGMAQARPVAVAAAVAIGLLAFTGLAVALRARNRKVTTGREGLVGQVGEVREALDPEGMVFVDGERWRAVASGGAIAPGARVRVTAVEGLTLRVERLQEGP